MPAVKASIDRVSEILRQAGALHGGDGNQIPAFDHLRRSRHISIWPRVCDRHALPFGSGDPAGGRQAGSSWPHGQGRRTLARVRLLRRGRPERGVLGINSLCDFLARSEESPVGNTRPNGADIDAVIDVRAIFQQGHRELAIEAMPSFLLPGRAATGFMTTKRCSAPT